MARCCDPPVRGTSPWDGLYLFRLVRRCVCPSSPRSQGPLRQAMEGTVCTPFCTMCLPASDRSERAIAPPPALGAGCQCHPIPIPIALAQRSASLWGGGKHKEHKPQRPSESIDPTQHAKGRTGDCSGPRKETATRRNVTQGKGGGGMRPERNAV